MRQSLSAFSCVALLLSTGWLHGQTVGYESLLFELAADARGAALGSNIMADLELDTHAAAANPCFLDSAQQGLVTIDYVNYYAGIGIATTNYQLPKKQHWHRQVGARFMNLGTFQGFDASGGATSDFWGGDQLIYYGTSRTLDSTWKVGFQPFVGSRHLDREVAVWAGVEGFVHAHWPERHTALGLAVTGWGNQWGWKGAQPTGRLPMNLQIAWTQGFKNAPFRLFLKSQHLEQWDLAPEGTYDDTTDPITGEVVSNSTFVFGDQLMRHMVLGISVQAGENMAFWTGFDYRRRVEMMATDRLSANGLSLGTNFSFGLFDFRIARTRYHFAGANTHIGIRFNPRSFSGT